MTTLRRAPEPQPRLGANRRTEFGEVAQGPWPALLAAVIRGEQRPRQPDQNATTVYAPSIPNKDVVFASKTLMNQPLVAVRVG
jgi:hypothetical protein